MKASNWLHSLPAAPTPERERVVLEAVIAGHHLPIRWAPLTTSRNGRVLRLWVAEDVLRIGEPGDSVRVTVSHRLAQLLADHFDARLPTPRISDLTFDQAAVRLRPILHDDWRADGTMASTDRMREYTEQLDREIGGRSGLVSTIGKEWCLTRQLEGRMDRGANYGWHYIKMGSTRVWQPVGTVHNLWHHDYSQSLRLVCRTVDLDGVRMPLDELLVSREIAPLVSHEGAMPFTRHPGVPWAPPEAPLEDP